MLQPATPTSAQYHKNPSKWTNKIASVCYASESATKDTELSLNQVQLTKLEKIQCNWYDGINMQCVLPWDKYDAIW
jgi:hypothetical protein